jgi:hypothetical protein
MNNSLPKYCLELNERAEVCKHDLVILVSELLQRITNDNLTTRMYQVQFGIIVDLVRKNFGDDTADWLVENTMVTTRRTAHPTMNISVVVVSDIKLADIFFECVTGACPG